MSNETSVNFVDSIISCFDRCSAFRLSVSFIKKAGLVLFAKAIEGALARGAKGQLLTSTYQNFTDIASLEMLFGWQEKYPNFECHLEDHSFGEDGFHTKGYIFDIEDHQEIIIGSSNITYFALKRNKEWDVKTSTEGDSSFETDVNREFQCLWSSTEKLTREKIKNYSLVMAYAIDRWDMDFFDPDVERPVRPNAMQRQALKELRRYRDMGQSRCLVVSAMGSGKTYLAAFDAQNFCAQKMLFIVHKDTILHEAMATFSKVFGKERSYGIYDGSNADIDADFIFASNQMMARHLNLFAPDEFDYIVIDEVHHASASTYQRIIDYFHPAFLLGLTATPDRMDGADIYDLFGQNVPYDLRLRDAILLGLVVPFHYYGIKDSLLSYASDDTPTGIRQMVAELSSQANCQFVSEQIEAHRPKGKLRCIAFCRNIDHARRMCQGMSEFGYHCTYLTGKNDTGERLFAFNALQDEKNPLEIVFAVDILNEGVDIPSVNLVLFLRPTESSTIFLQQLGRGLRKYENKEYLTVLDFIANSYRRSCQIAVALGELTKAGTTDKPTALERVRTNFECIGIPGLHVEFDPEAKKEILESIASTNFNEFKYLKKDFANFKQYLQLGPNEFPMHTDFLCDAISVDLLHYTAKYNSYYDFLTRIGQTNLPTFTKEQQDVLTKMFFFLPLVRPEEYWILSELLSGPKTYEELKTALSRKERFDVGSFDHALKVLRNEIGMPCSNVSRMQLITYEEKQYFFGTSLSPEFLSWVESLISYGLARFESDFYGVKGKMKPYYPYTAQQVLLSQNNTTLSRMTGVVYIGNELFLFIDLKKDLSENDRLNYSDKFLSSGILQWESQTETTMTNGKGLRLLQTGKAHVLVRKIKKEDGVNKPFLYLGLGTLTNPRDSGKEGRTLLFDIALEQEVPEEFAFEFGIEEAKDGKHFA